MYNHSGTFTIYRLTPRRCQQHHILIVPFKCGCVCLYRSFSTNNNKLDTVQIIEIKLITTASLSTSDVSLSANQRPENLSLSLALCACVRARARVN